ncbi:unnamed protein product [Fusarium graminearum]|nr:unnamed protein product [Fusarium graminearum]
MTAFWVQDVSLPWRLIAAASCYYEMSWLILILS